MKKIITSLALIVGLQAAPAPAHAGNGMGDIISTMMQMFFWMMSGGGGMGGMSGMNPLSMNPTSMYGANPYSFGGLGNMGGLNGAGIPFAGSGFPGYYGMTGSPNSTYPTYGYGRQSPYYDNRNQAAGGYNYNRYGQLDPRINPYSARNDYYRPDYSKPEAASPIVLQPIIVSPTKKSDGTATAKVEVLPSQTIGRNDSAERRVPPPPPPQISDAPHSPPIDSNIEGRWQGVNGEFLQLGATSFRLQSKNSDLLGSYELKNGIMKISVMNRTAPVYMQFRIENQHLAFLSEDGQKMLFRRF